MSLGGCITSKEIRFLQMLRPTSSGSQKPLPALKLEWTLERITGLDFIHRAFGQMCSDGQSEWIGIWGHISFPLPGAFALPLGQAFDQDVFFPSSITWDRMTLIHKEPLMCPRIDHCLWRLLEYGSQRVGYSLWQWLGHSTRREK